MLKYVNFLLFNIIRKWAVWVLLILSLVVTYFVIWIQINELAKYSIKFVDSINIYTKMMPFIFGISFISMIIVYVFKDGEEDGSDLLIISKPISRGKILFGKFTVIAMFILFFNVIYFSVTFIAAQADSFASMSERFKFASSIFIGGIVVSFIVGTIIVFAASYLSKMGALAIGIVSAAVVPIVSQVSVAVSKGIPTDTNSGYKRRHHIINYEQTEKILDNALGNFIQTGKPDINISDLTSIGRRQYQMVPSNKIDDMKKYIEDDWYDKASYIEYTINSFNRERRFSIRNC